MNHLMKPGMAGTDNPHHFIVVQVDGDRLSLEIVTTSPTPYLAYQGSAKIVLSDRVS